MKKEKIISHHSKLNIQNGITLIALVVTIVILLILAGITITAVLGDNGLINKAEIAAEKTNQAAQNDITAMQEYNQELDKLIEEMEGITDIYVTLYTDGTLGFSNNTETIEGKTVQTSYGNIKNQRYYMDYSSDSVEEQLPPWSENESIQTVIFTNEVVPQSTSYWFYGCINLTEIQNINNLNTSKVTDMNGMFRVCISLTNLDLSNFDTSKATDMSYMFESCNELTSLNLSNFDTSKVTDMSFMFRNCSSLASLNLSNFNTSQVTNMSCMFYDCLGLTSLDLSNFDTSKVTDMSFMFYDCLGLTSLDLSNFDTSKVTSMGCMFVECSNLITIYAGSNFVTTNVADAAGMFEGCSNLVGGNGTVYDSTHIDKEYARIDAEGTPGYFTAK